MNAKGLSAISDLKNFLWIIQGFLPSTQTRKGYMHVFLLFVESLEYLSIPIVHFVRSI